MRVETKKIINAKPEQVWAVLADLDKWSEWNPHIFQAKGNPVEGEKLQLTMWQGEPEASAAKNKTQKFNPTVVSSVENQEFAWVGRLLGIPGLFTGRHSYELTEVAGGTELTHSEDFAGLLVRPFTKMLAHVPNTFAQVNDALAERVEARI